MTPTPEKATNPIDNNAAATTKSGQHSGRIDPTAPAGSKNSLGAESVRDDRPGTDDHTVEAIDEEAPGFTPPDSAESPN